MFIFNSYNCFYLLHCWSLSSWGFVAQQLLMWRVPPGDVSQCWAGWCSCCAALMKPTVFLVSWLRRDLGSEDPIEWKKLLNVLKNGVCSVYLELRNCCEMRNCYLPVFFHLLFTTHILDRDTLGIPMLLKRSTTQSLALAHPAKVSHPWIYWLDSLPSGSMEDIAVTLGKAM